MPGLSPTPPALKARGHRLACCLSPQPLGNPCPSPKALDTLCELWTPTPQPMLCLVLRRTSLSAQTGQDDQGKVRARLAEPAVSCEHTRLSLSRDPPTAAPSSSLPRSNSSGELLNKAKREAMTQPNLGERENESRTPATTNPLSGSLGAGYQGRTEELLGFPDSALRFLELLLSKRETGKRGETSLPRNQAA